MKKFIPLVLVLVLMLLTAAPAMATETAAVAAADAGSIGAAILASAVQVSATLLITLIGVLGAWLTAKLAKKQQLANIAEATAQVIQAAQLTVGELQQTVVEKLKAAGGGKLTPVQIEDLKKQLQNMTYEKMSNPAFNLLLAARVDVEALVTGAAEDLINKIKAVA